MSCTRSRNDLSSKIRSLEESREGIRLLLKRKVSTASDLSSLLDVLLSSYDSILFQLQDLLSSFSCKQVGRVAEMIRRCISSYDLLRKEMEDATSLSMRGVKNYVRVLSQKALLLARRLASTLSSVVQYTKEHSYELMVGSLIAILVYQWSSLVSWGRVSSLFGLGMMETKSQATNLYSLVSRLSLEAVLLPLCRAIYAKGGKVKNVFGILTTMLALGLMGSYVGFGSYIRTGSMKGGKEEFVDLASRFGAGQRSAQLKRAYESVRSRLEERKEHPKTVFDRMSLLVLLMLKEPVFLVLSLPINLVLSSVLYYVMSRLSLCDKFGSLGDGILRTALDNANSQTIASLLTLSLSYYLSKPASSSGNNKGRESPMSLAAEKAAYTTIKEVGGLFIRVGKGVGMLFELLQHPLMASMVVVASGAGVGFYSLNLSRRTAEDAKGGGKNSLLLTFKPTDVPTLILSLGKVDKAQEEVTDLLKEKYRGSGRCAPSASRR